MLTIAVCDDNRAFANLLLQKIRKLCAYSLPERVVCQTAPVFCSANEVLNYLSVQSINILFLDIDMPEINGFQLATILQEQYPDTLIIFVSAYDNFVYSCFDYSPFSFLRKSKIEAELPVIIQKVVEKCIINQEALLFHAIEGEVSIRLKEILYFEGEKNYYIIHCTSGKSVRCRGTITTVAEMTIKYDFFRIHSAFVINLAHVESVLAPNAIRMKNGITLYISRSNLTAFKQAYMQYTRRRMGK